MCTLLDYFIKPLLKVKFGVLNEYKATKSLHFEGIEHTTHIYMLEALTNTKPQGLWNFRHRTHYKPKNKNLKKGHGCFLEGIQLNKCYLQLDN
jgi:hypothetical protein